MDNYPIISVSVHSQGQEEDLVRFLSLHSFRRREEDLVPFLGYSFENFLRVFIYLDGSFELSEHEPEKRYTFEITYSSNNWKSFVNHIHINKIINNDSYFINSNSLKR